MAVNVGLAVEFNDSNYTDFEINLGPKPKPKAEPRLYKSKRSFSNLPLDIVDKAHADSADVDLLRRVVQKLDVGCRRKATNMHII